MPERNLRDIEGLAARLEVLPFGVPAATLARAGTPIGPYDQMIAGHARSRGLTLVSNNLREFERVPNLLMENWLA